MPKNRRYRPGIFHGVLLDLLEQRTFLSYTLQTLSSFTAADGLRDVVSSPGGALYGIMNSETVVEIAPNPAAGSIATSVLATFTGDVGPGTLVVDAGGDAFGTTQNGGANNVGSIFEVVRGSGVVTTLASFATAPVDSGGEPEPFGLVLDPSGDLYGITMGGGAAEGKGSVFELAKGSNSIVTLASFIGSNGADPNSLVIDSGGNLFGETNLGGADNDGTVFKVAAGSDAITTVGLFDGADGNESGAGQEFADAPGLTFDSAGNLYGTVYTGGGDGSGDVFEIAKGSTTITVLASFDDLYSDHGYNPTGPLLIDSSGDLYGTTLGGGTGYAGVIWELPSGTGVITTLTSFPESFLPGADPLFASLDSNGNLFGTTEFGGDNGEGTFFELSPGGVGSPTPTASATISGFVYDDANGDGVYDDGEKLLGSVKVTIQRLSGRTPIGRPLTVNTDRYGDYSSTPLNHGDFIVTETLPSGYKVTQPAVRGSAFAIALEGTSVRGINFGDEPVATRSLTPSNESASILDAPSAKEALAPEANGPDLLLASAIEKQGLFATD